MRRGVWLPLVLTLLACSTPPDRNSAPHVPPQRIEERVTVTLPDGHEVRAEVADEPAETAIGLMGREEIREGEGMLFLFDAAGHHAFYMKNMLTSIDILWLAEAEGGGRVVHVERNVPPCEKEPCPNYYPMRAARYVLELRSGGSERHAAREGAIVRFTLPASARE